MDGNTKMYHVIFVYNSGKSSRIIGTFPIRTALKVALLVVKLIKYSDKTEIDPTSFVNVKETNKDKEMTFLP